jgi:hypothetical protein
MFFRAVETKLRAPRREKGWIRDHRRDHGASGGL